MEYVVKHGDTLWDISRKYLGDPTQWPRIWRYNNRASVIARTGKGIIDPDLIYPGQLIFIPIGNKELLPNKNIEFSKSESKHQFDSGELARPLSLVYDLSDFRKISQKGPGYTVSILMAGKITLATKKSYPVTLTHSNKGVELQVTGQANSQLSGLISDTGISFDKSTKKLTLKSGMTSNLEGFSTTYTGIEVSSGAKIKFVYNIKLPEIKGKLIDFVYIANDCTFAVEVELDQDRNRAINTVPVNQEQLAAQAAPAADDIERWIAIGLFAGAAAIVVGTIVEDFVTLGVGVADDPISFATASAMVARGMSLLGKVAPKAPVAARVVAPAGAAYAH